MDFDARPRSFSLQMSTPLSSDLAGLRAALGDALRARDLERARALADAQVRWMQTAAVDPLLVVGAHALLFELSVEDEVRARAVEGALAAAAASDEAAAVAAMLEELARTALRQGARDAAARLYAAVVERREALLRLEPEAAWRRGELGEALVELGMLAADRFFHHPEDRTSADVAEAALRRGISLWDSLVPTDAILPPIARLAFLLHQQNRYSEGVTLMEEAARRAEAELGPEDPRTARCWLNLGSAILEGRGFHARPTSEAVAALRRAAEATSVADPEGLRPEVERLLASASAHG